MKTKMNQDSEDKKENVMRSIKMEKIVLNVGGTAESLEKGKKLIEMLTKRKAAKMKSRKRIPTLGVRPNLEVGAVITLRKDLEPFLKRMLAAVDNTLRRKQISENNFSFGIKEYIEIPGTEYQRDLGIIGLDVTVVFKRAGKRTGIKKIKRGKIPKRQMISREEIIKYMSEKFDTNFV